ALFCQAYYGFTDKGGFLIPASVLSAALFAASDELHQLFVPGRSGEIADIALDSGGALLGVIASYIITASVLKCIKRRFSKHGAE
ncbi:MAG: VanZ family protein, partial [Clostridia bacterium]|nr:VanZ family protein [Clostridia bacterium]